MVPLRGGIGPIRQGDAHRADCPPRHCPLRDVVSKTGGEKLHRRATQERCGACRRRRRITTVRKAKLIEPARLDHPEVAAALAAGPVRGEIELPAVMAETGRHVAGWSVRVVEALQRFRLAPGFFHTSPFGSKKAPAVVVE